MCNMQTITLIRFNYTMKYLVFLSLLNIILNIVLERLESLKDTKKENKNKY